MAEKDRTLTVKEDRVLEAAKSCPDAGRILKTLFPEAFKAEDLRLKLAPNTVLLNFVPLSNGNNLSGPIVARSVGDRAGAIYLSPPPDGYEWKVVKDNLHFDVLDIFKK